MSTADDRSDRTRNITLARVAQTKAKLEKLAEELGGIAERMEPDKFPDALRVDGGGKADAAIKDLILWRGEVSKQLDLYEDDPEWYRQNRLGELRQPERKKKRS